MSTTFITDQIIGLIDQGHSVSVFSTRPSNDRIQHENFSNYNINNLTFYTGPPDSFVSALIGLPKKAIPLLMKHPVSCYSILNIACTQGFKLAGGFAYKALPVLNEDLDVLHAHFGSVARTATDIQRIGEFEAFVTSFHGTGIRKGEKQGGQIYNDLFNTSDCILANSEFSKTKLVNMGADPSQVRVLYVGIDPDKFYSSKEPIQNGQITILTVARLHKVKGHKYGLQAVKKLIDRYPDVDIDYRLVGDGPLRGDIYDFVEKTGMQDSVTICGAKTQSGVVEELAKADILLLPSIEEGFGKVLLEAQASKLPIVASDVGGISEAVEAGKSAVLVPPCDPEEIADKLSQIVKNPSTRLKMGRIGRKNIEKNFKNSILNKELERIYRDLVDQ